MPTEEITIVVEAVADKDISAYNKLHEVSQSYQEFITDSIKQPIVTTPLSTPCDEIIQELVDVSMLLLVYY